MSCSVKQQVGEGRLLSAHSRYLLDELNAGSQVHPEVDERPRDALLLVLLLLQHEHVVVEKLLQFLVGEVDAQLLQGVELHKTKFPTLSGFL